MDYIPRWLRLSVHCGGLAPPSQKTVGHEHAQRNSDSDGQFHHCFQKARPALQFHTKYEVASPASDKTGAKHSDHKTRGSRRPAPGWGGGGGRGPKPTPHKLKQQASLAQNQFCLWVSERMVTQTGQLLPMVFPGKPFSPLIAYA